ncbi:MAG TPA: AraC family transcriptional regulator [Opitutaceae bacterium]|jgi:AraC-like DNA-binding protein/mannose-6-phosphate isomerase-like protein (cupin superfamily)|nr:AraC family transcriptional regulator [Opitutaceae bacterium]
MLAWSPILVQKIEIHALGFVLRKLQLNRHREAEVASHHHAYAQLILYLSGEGVQRVAGRRRPARSGDLFIIPPRTPHGFSVLGHSRPLCLVLDFETESARPRIVHRHLPQGALNELHALLARVPAKGRPRLGDYASILAVVARLLEPTRTGAATRRPVATVERVLELLRAPSTLAAVARETGYHRDHLSRKLKHETGLGLRGLRDQLRLETAQHALRTAPTIAEAAAQAGFDDPNYFTRWFRRQTGRTPSAWLRR